MKNNKQEFALHNWIAPLPFTQQAVLFLCLRGADGMSKQTLSKAVLRYFRGAIIKPAYPDFGRCDNFMSVQFEYFEGITKSFLRDHDDVPHHFLIHLIHAAEIIGYKHSDYEVCLVFQKFYTAFCESFHMKPETEWEMDERLKY